MKNAYRIAEETRLNRLAKPEDIAHVMAQMMGEELVVHVRIHCRSDLRVDVRSLRG